MSNVDNEEYKPDELDKIKQVALLKKESKYLIENDEDLYKSLANTEKWKTSLLTNKKTSNTEAAKSVKINLGSENMFVSSVDEYSDAFDEDNTGAFEVDPEKIRLADESLRSLNIDGNESDKKGEVVVKSLNDMAKLLVNNIMQQAFSSSGLSEASSQKGDLKRLEKNFRYNLNNSKPNDNSKNNLSLQNESVAYLSEFNLNKSNSRVSYYREFQSNYDLNKKHLTKNEINEERNFQLQFHDEPDE